jgi:hypothetical protein
MSAFQKTVVFLVITATAATGLFAQVPDPSANPPAGKTVVVSLYLGLSLTNFLGDAKAFADTFNYYSGYDLDATWRSFIMPVGVLATINATPWLAFKTGIVYAPKGMKYKDVYDYGDGNLYLDLILKVHYIEIPVLVEFSLTSKENKDKTHVYINGGVAPAFKIGSKMVVEAYAKDIYGNQSDPEKETEDWPGVGKFDLAYVVGGGLKNKESYFGLQYERGSKSVSTAGWNFINQSYTFMMGFFF